MKHRTKTPLPSLRPDLDVIVDPGCDEGERYLLRDPATSHVWQIGAAERLVLNFLDGTLSCFGVWNVVAQQKNLDEDPVPTEEEIAQFVTQLGREGLLVTGQDDAGLISRDRSGISLRRIVTFPLRSIMRWLVVLPWDILSLGTRPEAVRPRRVRIGNPDRLLAAAARLLRPFVGRFGFSTLLAFSALGIGLLVANFDDWWNGVEILWHPLGMVVVVVTGVLAVHIPHQIVHGIVCVHHGGRVPAWGLRILLNVIPTFWIDVSDLIWLEEKRKRLSVIGVGLLWQLAALATGLTGWLVTDRGTFGSIAFLALSSTALFGFILNVNPLAQRDGYQLLSAWLEIPNLRARALNFLRTWVRWDPVPEPLMLREKSWFGLYATAVNAFGIFITVVGSLFALRLMENHGENGAISVMFAAGLVFQEHIRTVFERTGIKGLTQRAPRILRWVVGIAATVAVIWVLLLPYNYRAGGDAELEPDQIFELRTETEGLVDEVYVREGEWVEAGEPIARLVTHIQERNLHASEARLAETMARRSSVVAGTRPEEIYMARTQVLTAETRLLFSSARAERYTGLYEEEIVGRQDYENAVQLMNVNAGELEEAKAYLAMMEAGARAETLEAVEAEVDSLEAIVDHYEGDLKRTLLHTPISGQITTPRVEQVLGRYLKPGQRDLVATVEDTRILVAEVLVPEEDIDGVEIGNEVSLITWSYPDREFLGQVREVAPVAVTDELQRRKVVRVLIEIPNPGGELKPEMTGFAKIEADTRPVYDVLFRPLWRWLRIEVWSWIP